MLIEELFVLAVALIVLSLGLFESITKAMRKPHSRFAAGEAATYTTPAAKELRREGIGIRKEYLDLEALVGEAKKAGVEYSEPARMARSDMRLLARHGAARPHERESDVHKLSPQQNVAYLRKRLQEVIRKAPEAARKYQAIEGFLEAAKDFETRDESVKASVKKLEDEKRRLETTYSAFRDKAAVEKLAAQGLEEPKSLKEKYLVKEGRKAAAAAAAEKPETFGFPDIEKAHGMLEQAKRQYIAKAEAELAGGLGAGEEKGALYRELEKEEGVGELEEKLGREVTVELTPERLIETAGEAAERYRPKKVEKEKEGYEKLEKAVSKAEREEHPHRSLGIEFKPPSEGIAEEKREIIESEKGMYRAILKEAKPEKLEEYAAELRGVGGELAEKSADVYEKMASLIRQMQSRPARKESARERLDVLKEEFERALERGEPSEIEELKKEYREAKAEVEGIAREKEIGEEEYEKLKKEADIRDVAAIEALRGAEVAWPEKIKRPREEKYVRAELDKIEGELGKYAEAKKEIAGVLEKAGEKGRDIDIRLGEQKGLKDSLEAKLKKEPENKELERYLEGVKKGLEDLEKEKEGILKEEGKAKAAYREVSDRIRAEIDAAKGKGEAKYREAQGAFMKKYEEEVLEKPAEGKGLEERVERGKLGMRESKEEVMRKMKEEKEARMFKEVAKALEKPGGKVTLKDIEKYMVGKGLISAGGFAAAASRADVEAKPAREREKKEEEGKKEKDK